jgi:all-trans-8'-apo-beta-carotenal 15,15'-oxygenase
MQRRHLIHTAAASALAAVGATAAAPALAKPARAADFAAAVARRPLLQPFKGVDDVSGTRDGIALLRGRWPVALQGRFYRNGPAVFERAGERYHHWFDGDGMVQQFTIGGGGVSHRGRLVQTTKLQAERQAGRFLVPALGTHIEHSAVTSGPDTFNVANTNALEHAGRLLALWEGGSAYALDSGTLATQGPVVWGSGMQQVPFSAHPKVDNTGHLWNFGASGAAIVAWHIDPQGRLVRAQVTPSPYPDGMVHDMAVTPRYLVLPLPPVPLNFNTPVAEGPRRFALQPGQPLRVLVMEKSDIQRQRVFELPPEMVFHVGNAHETADGQVVLSYVGAPDAWFLDRAAVGLMAGHPSPGGPLNLRVVRLDMHSGRVVQETLPGEAGSARELEFPRIHPRRIGLPARWLVTGATWKAYPGRQAGLLHGVQTVDLHSGRVRRFDYGEHMIAEEHVVVPKPGQSGELDAWLLGTTFDARRQSTVLNLLDAAHVEDGPVAQAVLPYLLPLGFHGNFTPA